MTDIAKFDSASYIDKVRDKIKQSLIDVIPDDQWNTMLKAEISAFFETKKVTDRWSGSTTTERSEFHRIALTVIEEETKKRVRDMLSTPEWSTYWDGNQQKAGDEIARLARENGAAILGKWLESAIGQVLSNINNT